MAYTPPGQPLAPTIPDDVVRLAAMYPLGPFIKAYRAQERTRAMLIGCPIIILGPPLLCGGLIALLSLSYAISEQMGLKGSDNVPQIIAGGMALVLMAAFARVALPVAWTINASGTVVYLFQNGIIHSKGAQPALLFWPHIVSGQFFRAYRYSPTKLVIKTLDRRTITLHSITDLNELAGKVQQALAHRQPPPHGR
jgi:hypothetical protein